MCCLFYSLFARTIKITAIFCIFIALIAIISIFAHEIMPLLVILLVIDLLFILMIIDGNNHIKRVYKKICVKFKNIPFYDNI